jgi:hypothetical protein
MPVAKQMVETEKKGGKKCSGQSQEILKARSLE